MSSMNLVYELLSELRLSGFLENLKQQVSHPDYRQLSFEERVQELLMSESTHRQAKKIKRLKSSSKLQYKQAYEENITYSPERNLKREDVHHFLTENEWLNFYHNIIITGATGTGKSFLASVIATRVMEKSLPVKYCRINRLLVEITEARADGTYLKWLDKLSKNSVIILDDLGLKSLSNKESHELFELIEETHLNTCLIVISQYPVNEWYHQFEDPTIADGILDRILQKSHRIELRGNSLRRAQKKEVSSDTFD